MLMRNDNGMELDLPELPSGFYWNIDVSPNECTLNLVKKRGGYDGLSTAVTVAQTRIQPWASDIAPKARYLKKWYFNADNLSGDYIAVHQSN